MEERQNVKNMAFNIFWIIISGRKGIWECFPIVCTWDLFLVIMVVAYYVNVLNKDVMYVKWIRLKIDMFFFYLQTYAFN